MIRKWKATREQDVIVNVNALEEEKEESSDQSVRKTKGKEIHGGTMHGSHCLSCLWEKGGGPGRSDAT